MGTRRGMCTSDTCPTITVLHKGVRHKVPVEETIGQLRASTAEATGIQVSSISFLVRGKKFGPGVQSETPLADLRLSSGATVMLSICSPELLDAPPSASRSKLCVPEQLLKVRAIEKNVDMLNEDMSALLNRIDKLALGFLDRTKTHASAERLRRDCMSVEEGLMRAILAVDNIDSSPSEGPHSSGGQWRAERKALIRKTQQILRRRDDAERRLDQIINDEFDEMKHRRGSET